VQLRQNARRTVRRIREEAPSCEAYVGIWDTAAHFWCEELYSAGIAYSLHAHGLDVVVPLYGRLPEWRRRDFRNAKAIFANSSATAELVRNKIGNCTNIDVVHPGVGPMPDSSATTLEAARLRSDLGLASKPVLLTLARLVRRKGIDLVLRCIPDLLSNYPDLRYLVAGEGPEKDNLQTLARSLGIAGHVHFIEEPGEISKWALYEMCDVFVMPNRLLDGSDWEGFGIVFLEAALSGKPAIGGKNGGVPEAIENGVTGILVDPEQESSISNALHLLLDNAELRRTLGLRARLRALTKFSWPVIANSFMEHLASSVGDDN
jgi:phosphatidylinositol alpha-1,6-mannosyltransferase